MSLARLPITGSDANNWSDLLNRNITQTNSALNGAFNSFDQFSQRPTNLTVDDVGRTYLYTQTGNWHEWSGSEWRVQNKSEINVKDYGAVGDGVADDTVAVQSLLNKIALKRPSLYFPQGNYKITQPLNLTVDGSGSGGVYFGCGYSSILEYYPPPNTSSIADGFGGIIKAGVFNFGADNEYASFRDLRFVCKGGSTNNSCAIKGFKYYKGEIKNIIIEGFECGIHLSNSWTVTITNCAIKNCTYGILWDNTTIGTITKSDFYNCNIGIYFGWNLFGLNNIEPTLFAQGFTISENTIQSCKESAIVGKNLQVVNIVGNYTEGNCSGQYINLEGPAVLNSSSKNGAEIIISSSNAYGSSKISIQNNWFWLNQSNIKSPLAVENCFGLIFENNSVYSTEYLNGTNFAKVSIEGECGNFKSDKVFQFSGSGKYTSNNFLGNKSNLPDKFFGDFVDFKNLNVPSILSEVLFVPFKNCSNILCKDIYLTMPNDISQVVSIGIYETYLGSITRSFYEDDLIKSFNIAKKQLRLTLNNSCLLPPGNLFIAISFKGIGNAIINTLASGDILRIEQSAFLATVDFLNQSTFQVTSIHEFIKLPQLMIL